MNVTASEPGQLNLDVRRVQRARVGLQAPTAGQPLPRRSLPRVPRRALPAGALALVGECSIPDVLKVARQPFSSYRVSWRSYPWRAMPTATWPMPGQESSQVRSAQSARIVRGHGTPGEPECCSQESAALVEHALLDDLVRSAEN
jgi:hypothetical protein